MIQKRITEKEEVRVQVVRPFYVKSRMTRSLKFSPSKYLLALVYFSALGLHRFNRLIRPQLIENERTSEDELNNFEDVRNFDE